MNMDRNPAAPQRLHDLSLPMRKFLAGVRDDEIPNLRQIVEMREDEREKLTFLVTNFTIDDLETISGSLENMRTIKRFGVFGVWFAGAIAAGAVAVGLIKGWIWTGGPK